MIPSSRLQEIRERFRSEVIEHLRSSETLLQMIATGDASIKNVETLARHLHAIKGSAPIIGARPISEIAKVVEECVHQVGAKPSKLSPGLFEDLRKSLAFMREQADDFVAGRDLKSGEVHISALRSHIPELASKQPDRTKQAPEADMSRELREMETDRASEGNKRRILFVDDSQIARELYKVLLLRRGYEVEVAADGEEGLQQLREHEIDAVITDDQMPVMDGVELLKVARADERLKDIPVIVISGKANDEARDRAMKEGAASYLVKGDFGKEHLLEVLQQVLEEKKPR